MFNPVVIPGSLIIKTSSVHHWYDVLAGAIIGTCTAIVAFRQTFASVTDFRFNHLLLPRSTSLLHRQPYLPQSNRGPFFSYQPAEEYASHELPVAREGGWGVGGGEQLVGAPGDATAFSSGMGGLSGAQNASSRHHNAGITGNRPYASSPLGTHNNTADVV